MVGFSNLTKLLLCLFTLQFFTERKHGISKRVNDKPLGMFFSEFVALVFECFTVHGFSSPVVHLNAGRRLLAYIAGFTSRNTGKDDVSETAVFRTEDLSQ
jgi:hypothetical protein